MNESNIINDKYICARNTPSGMINQDKEIC